MSQRAHLILAAALAAGFGLLVPLSAAGCRRSPAPTPPASPGAPGSPAAAKESDASKEKPFSRKVLSRSNAEPWRVAGAFILVSHLEAPSKGPSTTRTRPEALQRIQEARARATSPEADFAEVARQYSDAPTVGRDGGFLGVATRKAVHPAFKEIVDPLYRLQVGEVSEPLEAPAGYFIVKRLPIEERAAAHVWIQFAGAPGTKPGLTRTKEDAAKLAQEVLQKAREPGARFDDIIQQYSEDSKFRKEIGGLMGVFTYRALASGGTQALGDALFRLKPGEISDVVESPYGFHILSLLPLEKYHGAGSLILVQYKGCKGEGPAVTRTREEARSRAEAALARILARESTFEAVAREVSEHSSATEGGFVGHFTKGDWPKVTEDAFFALEAGEVSDVLDTEAGFQILWRWE